MCKKLIKAAEEKMQNDATVTEVYSSMQTAFEQMDTKLPTNEFAPKVVGCFACHLFMYAVQPM